MKPQDKPTSRITQLRSLTPEELAAEFDLVYLEVSGLLQPIPADKVRSILPVFETTTVYADIGNRSEKYAEIEVTLEYLRGGLSVAESEIDAAFEDMLSTPFSYWPITSSFTEPVCNYCLHHDCQC